jgi:hypothetical protein
MQRARVDRPPGVACLLCGLALRSLCRVGCFAIGLRVAVSPFWGQVSLHRYKRPRNDPCRGCASTMLHKRLSNTAELVDCAGLTAEMAMGNVRQNEVTAGNSSVVIFCTSSGSKTANKTNRLGCERTEASHTCPLRTRTYAPHFRISHAAIGRAHGGCVAATRPCHGSSPQLWCYSTAQQHAHVPNAVWQPAAA